MGARRLFEVSLEAIDALERLVADEQIACGCRRTGHLQAAAKPSHFDGFREEQALLARVFGHRVELVPRAEPSAPKLGSDALLRAARRRTEQRDQSGAVDRGSRRRARRAGATIAEHTPVSGFSRSGSSGAAARWTVATSSGEVDAGDVVIATNGYTGSAAPELRRRLIPIGSYIVATEPLAAADAASILPRGRMAFDSKNFLYYWRLTDDRPAAVRRPRRDSRCPTPETTRRAASILRSCGLARVFPQAASARIECAWGASATWRSLAIRCRTPAG